MVAIIGFQMLVLTDPVGKGDNSEFLEIPLQPWLTLCEGLCHGCLPYHILSG